MFNSPVTKWWMNLDPAQQYMYWIIAFIGMLAGGVTTIILMIEFGMDSAMWMILVGGTILGFMGLFMAVVLFLTIVWPHLYKGYNAKENADK